MQNAYVNDYSPTVRTYYGELKKYKPITREEEEDLLLKAKNGDLKARDKILTSNLRFVFNTARRYKGKGVEIGDLICEGNAGLVKAIERYDSSRNVKFISYAVWWIRNSMQEFIKKKQIQLIHEYGDDTLSTTTANDEIADAEDEKVMVKETVLSSESEDIRKEMNESHKKIINTLLEKLSDRERFIIEEYYGLNNHIEKNLEDIGRNMNLTKERVRQLKMKAIMKLRSEVLLLKVSDFIFK